ncbi:MAG: TIGR02117 family protein [Sporocytophaga sp.]|uniref:TIGR02117 family protein n=1 Tax=Sporocytophaga sp. TaxID=2231183 RepID=UPI001B25DA7E|nr:TIGR02117 family protein [Sporocytophaga sp.]MBO9702654.1 TIGR02117 family protein [Sporocytophaga sp.]
MKRVVSILYKSFKYVFVFLLLYLVTAFVFTIIPVNNSFTEAKDGVQIFIRSNGVHTDIVVPVKDTVKDWRQELTGLHKYNENQIKYVAFGWGDKGFYLHTPTWADLKVSTVLKAAFWLSTSAMHVTYYPWKPIPDEDTRSIYISSDQYRMLVNYITDSFRLNSDGRFEVINCCQYSGLDNEFYEGKGVYSLLKTCNTWTNKGLKEAGVNTAVWAPFEWSVMYHRD